MKTAKEHIEIEFLKSLTYTEINEMFNLLKKKLDENEWISIEVGLPNDNIEVKVKVDCKHNGNGIIEPKYNAKYNHISKQWESGLSTLYFVTHWKPISTSEA